MFAQNSNNTIYDNLSLSKPVTGVEPFLVYFVSWLRKAFLISVIALPSFSYALPRWCVRFLTVAGLVKTQSAPSHMDYRYHPTVGPYQSTLRENLKVIVSEHPALSSAGSSLFRGFTQSGYSEINLFRNIMGDRTNDIRSWNYSKSLFSKIESGISELDAIKLTDEEMAAKVSDELEHGIDTFLAIQRLGSFMGVHRSDSVNFGTQLGGAIRWAKLYLRQVVANSPDWRKERAIVLDVREQDPTGLFNSSITANIVNDSTDPIGNEYHMFSYVRSTDIRGIYIGFPQNKRGKTNWYYLLIKSRMTDTGIPLGLTLFKVNESGNSFSAYKKIIDFPDTKIASRYNSEIEPLIMLMRLLLLGIQS